MRLRDLLAEDGRAFPWARALHVALALQLWSALLLLGLWLAQPTSAFPPLLGRVRLMPAHPEWYLAALVQNLAIGLVLVWLVRRLAVGWALLLAAMAGAAGWLMSSTHLSSSPIDGYVAVVRPVQEFAYSATLLGAVAAFGGRVAKGWGMLAASSAAGVLCGVLRLTLTNSVWGVAWNESWRFDLVVDALGGAAFGMTLLILARNASRRDLRALGAYVGTHGLAVLSLIYVQLAQRFADWTIGEGALLLRFVAGLALVGYIVLLRRVCTLWRSRPGPGVPVFASCAGLELVTVVCVICLLGRWPAALALLAGLGLIVTRGLAAFLVWRTDTTSA